MPIDPSLEQYDLTLAVTDQDIDMLGHVNNIVYLRWVQEAADSPLECCGYCGYCGAAGGGGLGGCQA